METVRVAIVGMGIGKANAGGFMRSRRGRVVALCDLLEERMREFAKDIPGPLKFYTDYREMCQDPEIDVHCPLTISARQVVPFVERIGDPVRAVRRLEIAYAGGPPQVFHGCARAHAGRDRVEDGSPELADGQRPDTNSGCSIFSARLGRCCRRGGLYVGDA